MSDPSGAPEKTLAGYCEPFSLDPGGAVTLKLGSLQPVDATVEVLRLVCGDPHTGFDERPVEAAGFPAAVRLAPQMIRPGSYASLPDRAAVDGLTHLDIALRVRASLPGRGRAQALLGTWNGAGGFALFLDDDGAPALLVGGHEVTTGVSLRPNRWYELTAGYDPGTNEMRVAQVPLPTRAPGDALIDHPAEAATAVEPGVLRPGGPLLVAAWWGVDGHPAAHFDGRLENPVLTGVGAWDFARRIGSATLEDVSGAAHHLQTVQCPARAVTGSRWDGSVQRYQDAPDQYAAVHFHHDDIVDAGWEPTVILTVPAGLASGLYEFRTTASTGEIDRRPFVVRPTAASANPVLFLLPTASYLAYANHRMTIEGTDFFSSRSRLRPSERYLRDHGEVGLSMYEYHPDRSGVMISSRLRPVINLEPGADGWGLTPDTVINAFLERTGVGHDVMTDEDLHARGRAALDPYKVVVTGSHPEYWSTAMLDALEGYLAGGGRLMYLGGNGFYWRVSFSPDQDGVMEVRRAEDGTRAWIAEPGEYYHQWGGEYGGLWRRLGRAPNLICGVGFAAQGFDRAAPYRRTDASFTSRASWIFDGVESGDVVGDYGVGKGAAGQEIDRYDPTLGSPPHAVVLATSTEHSDQMLRTKEELLATRMPMEDPKIRADMVFYETPAGGAVFSVGSIAWYGALPHQGWDNDISRITDNVVRRFADPEPFAPPGP